MTVDRKLLWGIAVIVIWFTASIARADAAQATAAANLDVNFSSR